MSEERDTVHTDLEIATGCDDEKCEHCDEVHPPVDIEKMLKKQTRWYKATVVAYFASLIVTTVCVYHLLGWWGAGAFVSGFGVYFFHLNMTAMVRVLMTLEQAAMGVGPADGGVEKRSHIVGSGGNYA